MKRPAFSLIELLVSISIIAVLMAYAIPNFLGARERARDAKKVEELGQLKNALRMYYNDYQKYPAAGVDQSIAGCGINGTSACPCDPYDFAAGADCSTVYMKKFPADIVFGLHTADVDEEDTTYTHYYSSGDNFCLVSFLENASDPELAASQSRCLAACGDAHAIGSYLTTSYVVCSY